VLAPEGYDRLVYLFPGFTQPSSPFALLKASRSPPPTHIAFMSAPRHVATAPTFLVLAFAWLAAGCQSPASQTASTTSSADLPAAHTTPPDYTYPDRDTVRVATWNVEHFVDSHDDPYVDSDRENDPGATMDGRAEQFADALRQMNADVVVLQEVESEAFVQTVLDERLPDAGYEFTAAVHSPTWYMNVVVVSRFPLGVLDSYADVTTPIVGIRTDDGKQAAQSLTNHRVLTLDVYVTPDYTLTITGAHLKAGRGARNTGWRVGQIELLHREYAARLAQSPEANLLVAGDLNALADSPELRLLLNDDARPAPDSLLQNPDVGPVDAWTARFVDPMADQETFTHPSDAPERQLDYLLVGEHLRPELVEGSARVARPLAPDVMAATSDHLPVVATFRASNQE